MKHGGTGIMVWGCMGSVGLGDLTWVTDNINADVYVDILCDHMLPSAHRLIGPEILLQHDNAPAHKARVMQEFMTNPTPDFIQDIVTVLTK